MQSRIGQTRTDSELDSESSATRDLWLVGHNRHKGDPDRRQLAAAAFLVACPSHGLPQCMQGFRLHADPGSLVHWQAACSAACQCQCVSESAAGRLARPWSHWHGTVRVTARCAGVTVCTREKGPLPRAGRRRRTRRAGPGLKVQLGFKCFELFQVASLSVSPDSDLRRPGIRAGR